MRFLFVDQIKDIQDDCIRGSKHFASDAPMQYSNSKGEAEIAPGVISEAIGQLVSWLCIDRNGYSGRPVFLFADKIEILGKVLPGSTVDLVATVNSIDEETFVFSGEASVDGRIVHRVERVSGYFMPLGDLEDPEVTKSRYSALTNGGLKLDGDTGVYDFTKLVDDVTDRPSDEKIVCSKTMAKTELFYKDHFPRFPVTPIVMINEMIGLAAANLLCPNDPRSLRPKSVDGIKIRNFVKPGETVETSITVKDRQDLPTGASEITTIAQVTKDGKTILRGKYIYELTPEL
jgi:3-hydroxymyristoyl/3-hydroxydecanoyl-(acyl carrier protein) dehydratase